MSINGQVKFLYKSAGDKSRNPVLSSSTNESFLNYLVDRLNSTYWISSGSDDTTTEYIEIEFDQPRSIDRLLLIKNNFKDFNAKYDILGSWTHFSNVETLEGTQTNITETDNAKDTNYYQFDSVTTQKIRIEILKTQTVDQEKYLYQCIPCEEFGTFEYWPIIRTTSTKNKISSQLGSGKKIINNNHGAIRIDFDFKNYMGDNDLELSELLINASEPVLVWLCGANEDQFTFNREGYRLEDIYLCKVENEDNANFTDGFYKAGYNRIIQMFEHV